MKGWPTLVLAALGMLVAVRGQAQQAALPPKLLPPKMPPPEYGEVVLGEGNVLKVQIHAFQQYVTQQTKMTRSGKDQIENVVTWVLEKQEGDVPAESYRVVTIGGQPLDEAAVKKLYAEKRATLICSHGKRIDPKYAEVFKPETPVVYLRPGALAAAADQARAAANPAPSADVFVSYAQEVPQPVLAAPPRAVAPTPTPNADPLQPVVMPPGQASGMVANGKITLIDYSWRPFSLWKTRDVEKSVSLSFGGETTVKESVSVSETIWAPTQRVEVFPLASVQVIGHDGQLATGVDLSTRLAKTTSLLWHLEGTVLDTRFCQFLKPDALIVKTPMPPPRGYEGSLSCAPQLEFNLAQAEGDQLTLSKLVFEDVMKQVPYTATIDGVPQTYYNNVRTTVSKPFHSSAKLSEFDAVDGQGNPLTLKQVQGRLAQPTPVLVCEFSHIDPMQFKLLKPDVILLKRKQNELQTPMPAPLPAVPSTP